MKWEQILPELLALIGGLIIFFICISYKKTGEYTFITTFVVSFVLYICGHVIKMVFEYKK